MVAFAPTRSRPGPRCFANEGCTDLENGEFDRFPESGHIRVVRGSGRSNGSPCHLSPRFHSFFASARNRLVARSSDGQP